MLEEGAEPQKYSGGTYSIKGDSVLITSNYSSQPSQTLNKTIAYKFNVDSGMLTLRGMLPNGMQVESTGKN